MTQTVLALSVLALSALACGTYITPTPTVEPTQPTVANTVSTALLPTPRPSPTSTAQADTATILRPVVNLRAEAGGDVVESVTAGTVVTVIECGPEWCQVEYMEQIFYVWRGCLDGYADGRGCEAE